MPLDPNGYDHEQRLPPPNGDAEPKQQSRKPNGQDRGGAAHGELSVIRVVASEMPRVVDEAERALLGAGLPIFTRGGTLVRPVIDRVPASQGRMTITPRLRPLCVA